eukprot:maker-scaffold_16-snap-gene-1.17-mRNA-1 protein AED:0.00 eAED:0.00 QI:3/0.88/0.9/1/0.55/0.4/10/719/337
MNIAVRTESTLEQPSEPLVYAKTSNINIFTHSLKGVLNGKKNQTCLCQLTKKMISLTTTDPSLSAQALVKLRSTAFDEWRINPEVLKKVGTPEEVLGEFRINLATLIHCLGTMNSSILSELRIEMKYLDEEDLLSLQIKEGDVKTECEIKTYEKYDEQDSSETDDSQAGDMSIAKSISKQSVRKSKQKLSEKGNNISFSAAFRSSELLVKGLIKSDILRDILLEFSDLPEASRIWISIDKTEIKFSCKGSANMIDVELPTGAFRSLEVFPEAEEYTFSYRLSLMNKSRKPLFYSNSTILQINEEGCICFQNMVIHEKNLQTTVDYFCLSNANDECIF